ncbi:menaquinone-dependent protoporphyrinogen IX dehydrogenase [Gammaproteobacteria bacterium]|nr:menaquinone-dependent protoporphyrinogen IX dehydrogenase [Gammaproteobacteria bacterium]MDA7821081.1 menaquinone-dependent protoporphyrinogen IX dehydrogenase [Gammaproteobacteria bacterium]MDA8674766.1 menaquinone-dependent protoporphyrinogen IX dehydrogenase [Gammaproteobacteria bacterium]MDB3915318.1 menaquinone-dependent protoporphyrinogen IX dehydrogenase [Gammaproteobacteria bacterium]MDB4156375.1 menaquinone-dependent protoporphyrinogen IX dehydrogenase [Gammaproteobacteria bacterium
MKSTLIIYSTTDGQTLEICKKIFSKLNVSESSNIIHISKAEGLDLNQFDKIIIGASIRYGKHKPELYEFIKKNITCLEAKENAFFSVNVVARKPEKNTPETNPYMQKFLELSPWSPKKLAVFAGKIDYPKYKFIDKHMIRLIMWITNGPTDVKNTYEFTDWNGVDEFSKQLNT